MTPKTATALSEQAMPIFRQIGDWFESPLGQHVLQTETAMLDQLLPGMFGYHLAQFSVQGKSLHTASPVQTRVNVELTDESATAGMISSPVALPFANDSVDVVLLHHLLDFCESPQEILREMSRVTLPMGHIVIVGFNPLSLWGAWRGLARFRGTAPWQGAFFRAGRVMDWLNLLNFKIDRAQYAIYRPPVSRYAGKVSDYSMGVSRNLNVPVGAVYVIVARKQVGAARSIKPVWRSNQTFGRLSVVRSVKHEGLSSIQHPPNRD